MNAASDGMKRTMSLPARGAWIEIGALACHCLVSLSLPARGAWIEMYKQRRAIHEVNVAPRTGSVD